MEEKRPPMPPQHPAHVLAKMEKSRQQKEKLKRLLPIAALVTVLVIALGIWIGVSIGKPDPTEPPPPVTTTAPPETTVPPETTAPPETTEPNETTAPPETTVPPEPWKTNILRSDEMPRDEDGSYVIACSEYSVFGSDYQRGQIHAVTFLDTLSGAPADAWDVSKAGDGSVMAWVEPDSDLYRLTIAGEGGVSAGTSCHDLFSGYRNMTRISFGGNFHTDTVQDMSNMFYLCDSLTSLDLRSFDTTAVQDMRWMFGYCYSLTSLDLRSFDTSAVQDMGSMFYFCDSLTSLDLSEKFVTTNADTGRMFYYCPAKEKYQHLLNN